jgi:porin
MKRKIGNNQLQCRLLAAAAGFAWIAVPVAGQVEMTDPPSDPTGSELADVPVDLPGHDEGPRSREAKPEEPAPTPEESAAEGSKPWWEWDKATGNWWGLRDKLSEGGLDIAGSYTMDWSHVFSGGAETNSTYRHILDFNAKLDLGKVVSLEGGSLYIDFYSISNQSVGEDAGSFLSPSDMDIGDGRDQIAELWYEQWLFDRVLRVKVGKIEANSEFAFPDSDLAFINTAAWVSPTVQGFATYPDPATGVVLFVYPTDFLYFGAGLFDGATHDGINTGTRGPATFFSDSKSDSWSILGEAGATWKELGFLRDGRIGLGGWGHTGDFDRFDGGVEDGTAGFYAVAQSYLWKPDAAAEGEDDARGVEVLFQYGWADEDIAEATNHFGAGVQWHGPLPGRDADITGAYISYTDLSDEPGAGFDGDETTLEFFYQVQVTPFVTVKPDLQWIIDPSGGGGGIDDAVVGTLRVEVSF